MKILRLHFTLIIGRVVNLLNSGSRQARVQLNQVNET